MDEYHLTDTAGSYVYELHRQPTDSVPAVHDEFGDVYVDNRYVLRISRAGNQFFCQEFTKRSFKSRLDKNFYENAIFDGFRFTKHEGGKLYFSVCVSYPDSDLSQPFILCVSPDGSFTIEQDNSPDLEA
ncbi:MAG: DUF4738 domain-containing protein [Bacteroidaceae bacterium]|nr:DUF4738 domain-containing protein [Bacteroidaceae bacterium]